MTKQNDILNKKTSVLFATFAVYVNAKPSYANGMIEPILSFFLPKVNHFTLLVQPHTLSDRVSPIIELYEKEVKKKEITISPFLYLPLYLLCKIQNSDDTTHISFKLRDLIAVLYTGFFIRRKHDIFIGLESINALAGIILKKFGMVKTAIYYVPDYSPKRFGNGIFNTIYNWLDRFCVEHADFTWDVSPMIKEARIKFGILRKDNKKILHVHNGLFETQIDPSPITQRIPESIVYMGLLDRDQGVDLALKAFKLVHDKKPHSTFHIIGGTNRDPKPFMQMVKNFGIEDSVTFYGFIPPNQKMSTIINECCIGIGAYRINGNPRNKYGDSGKIRQYLGCGLPIVATTIQWYTKYVIKKGAGIGVKETPEDFARAIITLFEDQELYKRCSEKAIELSRDNTWENSYANAIAQMQNLTFAQK